MELKNLDLLKLQTVAMQRDPTTKAISETLETAFITAAKEAEAISLWSNLENLPEEILDAIAWGFKMTYYRTEAPRETKVNLIRSAQKVLPYLGTPFAVEQVVQDYFGDGKIEEWFEYDAGENGQPFHFRVKTANAAVTGEQAALFALAVNGVKNLRSIMDSVIITMETDFKQYVGMAVIVGEDITIRQVI